jgi:single-strand DNA-binding protein
MSVNKVTLLGNTGKDPDFKTFENGGCVAQFTLATTKRAFTTKDGRQIPERTEWHNIVLQNGLAKVAQQYVHKGDKLYIEGELRTRSYDDANGVKRYITEIVATDMEMLTPKATGAGTQAPPPPAPDAPAPNETDDLPF